MLTVTSFMKECGLNNTTVIGMEESSVVLLWIL